MRGSGLPLFLSIVLLGAPGVASGQATSDPEVAKGVRQVEEGDYEIAILTLDAATRRLAAKRASSPDLGQAYLYLGIAYVAKGHETLAKAKFQEALAHTKDLGVNPDKFPPKVLELIEEARHEAIAAAPKRGGLKTALILLGVGGAATAGVAVAAGGGASQAATAQSTPTTTTLPGMPCNQQTVSGTSAIVTNTHQLGRTSGTFSFQWDAQQLPDQFEVFYQGQRLFNSGSVTGAGSTLIPYSGSSSAVTVTVTAMSERVLWTYIVGCP